MKRGWEVKCAEVGMFTGNGMPEVIACSEAWKGYVLNARSLLFIRTYPNHKAELNLSSNVFSLL